MKEIDANKNKNLRKGAQITARYSKENGVKIKAVGRESVLAFAFLSALVFIVMCYMPHLFMRDGGDRSASQKVEDAIR